MDNYYQSYIILHLRFYIYNFLIVQQLCNLFFLLGYILYNIDSFINQYGTFDKIILMDEKQANFVNSYLTNENLSILKDYTKLLILYQYGQYGDSDYKNIFEDQL